MNCRLRTLLILAVIFALQVIAAPLASAAECESLDIDLDGCITIDISAPIVDKVNLTIYQLPQSGHYVEYGDTVDTIWNAFFTPYCSDNVANGHISGLDALCFAALNLCAIRGSDAIVAMYMVLEPLIDGPVAQTIGPICFEASARVDFGAQIQELVEQEIGADSPSIVLQPADAIVNLPMIASTDPRPAIQVDITEPVVGTATATPEFTWAFAEGAAAHGPGLPYDGTSPTLNPGYYVAYTYGSLGTPTVGLTVTWRVVFTMPGETPVPLDDVVRTNSQTTRVRAAGSELIGG